MRNKFKLICLSALLASAASQAYEADITVTAKIDPTAGITLANGDSLDGTTLKMKYNPQTGLDPIRENVKIWSNADTDMNVKLLNPATLTDTTGANPIPLAVTLNNQKLELTDTLFQYKDLFPSDSTTNGSAPLPLVIKQANPGKSTVNGEFKGSVVLVVSQATTKNGQAASGGDTK